MENNDKKINNLKKFRELQETFDKSIRTIERCIAESITNKEKLVSIKRDLNEANNKFIEAEKCLDELQIDIENITIKKIDSC